MSEHHCVIIVGAGLSGLYAAWQCQQRGQDVIVLETRERIGGRILSAEYDNSRFDLGPAWIWPQLQPLLAQLLSTLDIDTFKQFTQGDMLYEKKLNDIERYTGQSSHAESYRIAKGSQSLVDELSARLSESCIHLNTTVTAIEQANTEHKMRIHVQCQDNTNGNGKTQTREYTADRIILALPLRLMQQQIHFTPAFDKAITTPWCNTPTWMSTQCKILFVYERAFWREQGLSGEVFSHAGPLSEIYDASTIDEQHVALTAFVGVNAQQRSSVSEQPLIDASLAQLARLFGDESQKTLAIHLKDWAKEAATTTEVDLNTAMHHPEYSANLPRDFWNKTLILAGTESSQQLGGYLEGALMSAVDALELCGDFGKGST